MIDLQQINGSYTLPTNPAAGEAISFYCNGEFQPVTVLRNGNRINGRHEDLIIDRNGMFQLIWTGVANNGWMISATHSLFGDPTCNCFVYSKDVVKVPRPPDLKTRLIEV